MVARPALKPRRSLPPDPKLARIWAAVAALPRGSVATYGTIAARAGLAGRARLVGRALKLAPAALKLPWHRVIAAGGRIAFAPGSRNHREQRRRLLAEGQRLVRGRVLTQARGDLDALLWGRHRC